jgi:hypothetical protein
MTRKDSEKESERPHYYSQFWLDIAAGRRTIGGPKPEDGEAIETETAEPVLQRSPRRANEPEEFHTPPAPANGYREEVAHPVTDEDYSEPEEDLTQDQEEFNEGGYQEDLPLGDDEGVPDVDFSEEEEENTSEENALEGNTLEENTPEENENMYDDDDETSWGGRSRKKAKPIRPNKPPIKKPGKTRRSF